MHLSSTSILITVRSAYSQVLQWQQTTDGAEYWMELAVLRHGAPAGGG